ncbi:hypothetical protein FJTKL_14066 [Diaporthe vaccinii]|uniref:Uncharacterized protein n=1 Tax=Diaporthe vaccinii TaxID=105482 RepID=A0ABR4E8X8_9PEZI
MRYKAGLAWPLGPRTSSLRPAHRPLSMPPAYRSSCAAPPRPPAPPPKACAKLSSTPSGEKASTSVRAETALTLDGSAAMTTISGARSGASAASGAKLPGTAARFGVKLSGSKGTRTREKASLPVGPPNSCSPRGLGGVEALHQRDHPLRIWRGPSVGCDGALRGGCSGIGIRETGLGDRVWGKGSCVWVKVWRSDVDGQDDRESARLTSEAGTSAFAAALSSLRTRADAVLEELAMSLLGAGAAAVVLIDLTSLATSRGAVTLVMVAAGAV